MVSLQPPSRLLAGPAARLQFQILLRPVAPQFEVLGCADRNSKCLDLSTMSRLRK